jgi:hypothetical protein
VKKLSNYFLQKSTKKELAFWFVTTYLLYFYMILFPIAQLKDIAGGMRIPDMMPGGYDPAYLYSLLVTLGHKGRNLYLFKQIPFDMIYPFLYGFSFTLLLNYIYKLLYNKNTVLQYFCLIPFVAALFDYAENISIANLLYTFPYFSINIARVASVFTVLKSSITILSFVLVFAGLISVVIKRLIIRSGKKNTNQPDES